MKPSSLMSAMALTVLSPVMAQAQSLEERVSRLETENRAQAATIARQQAMLDGSPERVRVLAESDNTSGSGLPGWVRGIEISGLIEIEASHTSPEEGDHASALDLATLELGIAAQVNDWVGTEVLLSYDADSTDFNVDIAAVTIANVDQSPLFFTAGQFYVPFGAFETNLVSDPLTLSLGETRETAARLGFAQDTFIGSVYVFNGDRDIDGDDTISTWGAHVGVAQEFENADWSLGAGYLSDLGDADGLQDVLADNLAGADPRERTAGWTAHASACFGAFNLIGEYLGASDDFSPSSLSFEGEGARPSAWNLELGYSFPVMGRESVAAVAYQGTREALALELPKERWLVGWSVEILDHTSLGVEWSHDIDYERSEGGSGEASDTLLAKLAVEF